MEKIFKNAQKTLNALEKEYWKDNSDLDKLQEALNDFYDSFHDLHSIIEEYIIEEENKPCVASFELCAGRHNTPAKNGAIFENEIQDVTDLEKMYAIIKDKLDGYDEVIVYVTGLTVALVEVINFCQDYHISLTLMHYNKETDSYYKQIAVEIDEWD